MVSLNERIVDLFTFDESLADKLSKELNLPYHLDDSEPDSNPSRNPQFCFFNISFQSIKPYLKGEYQLRDSTTGKPINII